MKGLFFVYKQNAEDNKGGIEKKIDAQIRVFNDSGLHCEKYVVPIERVRLYSLKWRLPFYNISPHWQYDPLFETVDYIYMRRPFIMNKYMVSILAQIREKNPGIKILIEIPTYPYDSEYDSYKFCGLAKKTDIVNRKKLRDIIDYFVTVTDDKNIFGVNTINIKNGIDLDRVPVKHFVQEKAGEIHLCAVAQFKYWHGYERFLLGLGEYYKNGGNRKITCDFVGQGTELPIYENIVNNLGLQDNIIFHGYLDGDKLENIYDNSSIALGTLGMYKKQLFYSCDLKSRESLGRGIPMIIACNTEAFDSETYKYFVEFPNDSSLLDINKIIEFHDRIYSDEDGQTVINNIRLYGERTVDMKICMQPVVDYLKE